MMAMVIRAQDFPTLSQPECSEDASARAFALVRHDNFEIIELSFENL
jgi:hypothetical protein